jgi:hypothetical protein
VTAPEFRCRPFVYDIGDLRALAAQVQRNRMRWYRIGAVATLGMVAVIILIDASIVPGDLDWASVATAILAAVLLLLFASTRFRAWIWLKVMRRSPFHAPMSFALMPTALFVDSPKGRSEIPFSAMHDVKRADDRVFLFMSKRLAYIVPRRAFETDEQFEAFAAAAHERWRDKHRL